MVVAKIRVAVDDPLVAGTYDFSPEIIETQDEAFFLDGPVAARVAIVDRDPASGLLANSVPWQVRRRRFDCPEDISAPGATAVSVFGLVLPDSRTKPV